MHSEFTSPLLENAVSRLSTLPGIGRKTALRLALHILRRDLSDATALGEAIINLRNNIRYCNVCHNISEEAICPICSSPSRDKSIVCVVETIQNVVSIENTGQFKGLYHVLGGVISPVEGISPDMLEIDSLIKRAQEGEIKEIILGLGATVDCETTSYYLYRRLVPFVLKITQLARGVSVGNEIEYTDEATLGRSLADRIPFMV